MYSFTEIGDETNVGAAQGLYPEGLGLRDSGESQVTVEPVPYQNATFPSPLSLLDSLAQYSPLTPPISLNPSRRGIIAPSSTADVSISPARLGRTSTVNGAKLKDIG